MQLLTAMRTSLPRPINALHPAITAPLLVGLCSAPSPAAAASPLSVNVINYQQQDGTIRGKVITSDGQPAEHATVRIKGKTATRVDKNGSFSFNGLEAGTYILSVT